jgi:hypothetical protein
MTLFRRFPAVVLAASALLLAGCGSGPVGPSDPVPTGGEVNDNPLLFFVSPSHMFFETTDGQVPGPQTVATTGLVAIGSIVTFDRFSYNDEGVAPWLRVAPVPTFQREPLAWLNTVWVDPAAYNSLPVRDEAYTAVVHANVVAALNTPQHLFVSLCNDPDGCFSLRVGDVKSDDMPTGQEWNRGDPFNPAGTGFYYRDWHLFVEPFSTVRVRMNGGGCGEYGGTLSDPYQYVFDLGFSMIITSDDDSDCLNSWVYVTNSTGSEQEYLLRATTYSGGDQGTYTMIVEDAPPTLTAEPPSNDHPQVAAKRNRGN